MDSLATAGRRFTDAHSPSAVCTPSRYGLLTGSYPLRINLWGAIPPLRQGLIIDPDTLTLSSCMTWRRTSARKPTSSPAIRKWWSNSRQNTRPTAPPSPTPTPSAGPTCGSDQAAGVKPKGSAHHARCTHEPQRVLSSVALAKEEAGRQRLSAVALAEAEAEAVRATVFRRTLCRSETERGRLVPTPADRRRGRDDRIGAGKKTKRSN